MATIWASRAWELNDLIPGQGAGGSIRGIVQADDGSLVIATTVGLFQFDGESFSRIPLELPEGEPPHVLHVARTGGGAIAAALASGRVAWLGDAGRIKTVAAARDQTNNPATSLCVDRDGRAWVGHEDGTIRRIDASGEHRMPRAADRPPTGRVHVTSDKRGNVWCVADQSLSTIAEGTPRRIAGLPRGIAVIAPSGSGGVWVAAQGRLMRFDLDGGERSVLPEAANFSSPPVIDVIRTVRSLTEDRAGRLWLCSSRYGLFVLEGERISQVDVGETWVTNAMEDREGNIWVGTRLAIHRVRAAVAWPTPLPTWQPVVGLCRDGRGSTWCATQNGEVACWPDGRLGEARFVKGVDGTRAVAIGSGGDGVAWAAMEAGELFRLSAGTATAERLPSPYRDGPIGTLLATRGGDVWVTVGDNALRRRGEQWMPVRLPDRPNTAEEPSLPRSIRGLAEDGNGGLWLTTDTELFRIDADGAPPKTVSVADLGSVRLGPIVECSSESLWLTLRGVGLARLKGNRWAVVTPADGLPADDVVGSVRDGLGRLWCASSRMLFVVDIGELGRVADGTASRCHCWVMPPRYETDFLEALATPFCPMIEAADGSLLAARQSGLVVCRPDLLTRIRAPTVSLRGVVSDQAVRYAAALQTNEKSAIVVALPASPLRVEVDFAATTLLAPTNVLVEYRLEGIDKEWMPAALHGRARYASLPSGAHRFWLRTSDDASEWSPATPAVTLVVAPLFWETWWFRGVALMSVAGLAAAVAMATVTQHGRRRMALLRQQAAVDRERMRLARDMHDEVGTNLTQIALLAEVAKAEVAPTEAEQLETVARISRQTVAALDELVWAVDPGNDTLAHLLSYVCRYASETLREFGVACDVERPTELPPLAAPGDFRRAVLLIVKEAITNVLAHAHASRVVLRIETIDRTLRISISDDGIGIGDPACSKGAGLGNMRHRAAALGGSCRIEPEPAAGTRVVLDLPLASPPTNPA